LYIMKQPSNLELTILYIITYIGILPLAYADADIHSFSELFTTGNTIFFLILSLVVSVGISLLRYTTLHVVIRCALMYLTVFCFFLLLSKGANIIGILFASILLFFDMMVIHFASKALYKRLTRKRLKTV
jgi:hypothetical protein